ncbi:hypothetical protein AB0395_07910 [Streptosporangium sp. NPDC051023]|uniref:hypothetical protein n=1 Tax=Streptosporangium sp. NPDC051023 TaxID=3155410 RepID=UPI00344E137E
MTSLADRPDVDAAQQETLLRAAYETIRTADMSPAIGGDYSSAALEEYKDIYLGSTALKELVADHSLATSLDGEAAVIRLATIQASADIRFGGGVPVGGWSTLALYPNGAYVFSGHLHDSGFPSYNGVVSWILTTRDGNPAFSFSAAGRMHGTVEPGSRDWNWTKSGVNPGIAAAWPELASTGYRWAWRAGVNISLGPIIDALKQTLGIVGAVIAVV